MSEGQSEDERRLLSLPQAEFGREARSRALAAYEDRDWQLIHDWTKSWISSGGGAWTTEAWLLYVVSALLQGWPRSAVHSVDMALGTWIEAPEDRGILHWVRASVIHHHLKDPKTALADYEAASEGTPDWLRERAERDLISCSAAAEKSRKRKPSVAAAPDFEVSDRSFVTRPTAPNRPGAVPEIWPQLLETLDQTAAARR
jgi:hypothetical protein